MFLNDPKPQRNVPHLINKSLIKFVSNCNVFEDKFSKFVAFDANTHTKNTYMSQQNGMKCIKNNVM
jgi:hypothetical protein